MPYIAKAWKRMWLWAKITVLIVLEDRRKMPIISDPRCKDTAPETAHMEKVIPGKRRKTDVSHYRWNYSYVK